MTHISFINIKQEKMIFVATTYRTLTGTKEIIDVAKKSNTKWVVYNNNKPAYFVDLFDIEKESNAMMNSLVLCAKRPIKEVLTIINKKHNINLSIPTAPCFGFKKTINSKELHLETIPEKWLDYSL